MLFLIVKKFLILIFYNVKKEDLDFPSGYEIEFLRNDTFNCLVFWFDVIFSKLPNQVVLKTSPLINLLIGKQTIFNIENDVKVEKGEKLKGCICVVKDNWNFTFFDVKISYHFEKEKGDYVYYYKIT